MGHAWIKIVWAVINHHISSVSNIVYIHVHGRQVINDRKIMSYKQNHILSELSSYVFLLYLNFSK